MTIIDNKINLKLSSLKFLFPPSRVGYMYISKSNSTAKFCWVTEDFTVTSWPFLVMFHPMSMNWPSSPLAWFSRQHRPSPIPSRQFRFILTTSGTSRASQHGCQLFFSLGLWVKEQPWPAALLTAPLSSSKTKAETEAHPEGNFSPLLGQLFEV